MVSRIKTRFSPSPTGHLHIGGARTALFAWLYAKRHQGQFILRIEDTDRARSKQEYTDAILEAMVWLGLTYDGDPFFQSQRFDRYAEVVKSLQETGHVYRCQCTQERLDEVRRQQQACGEKPRYDGHCRALNIDYSQPGVLRFRTPATGTVSFQDGVHGEITVSNAELDDLILVRSDGVPTYNFTVVVDDADMQITHVLRGDDHINNTPRQIHLYQAMGWNIPVFCHMPMILGEDGKRLSKRHGALSVLEYREQGYLPHAMLNYLARLGWSHGDQEIFSQQELIEYFDLQHLSHSPGMFNHDKLSWVNQITMQHTDEADLQPLLQQALASQGLTECTEPPLSAVIDLLKDRSHTLVEMATMATLWYQDKVEYDEAMVAKHCNEAAKPVLMALQDALAALADWSAASIQLCLKQMVKEKQLKFGQVALPLRVALTGHTASPSIDQTTYLLGQVKVVQRIKLMIDRI